MRGLKVGIVALTLAGAAQARSPGFLEQLTGRKAGTNTPAAASGLKNLTHEQLAQGLKEALTNGVQHAIAQLGHEGGFLTNLEVKIPMPEKLRTVEKTLRELKQDKLANDFIITMNHAAEQAVPEALSLFAAAIREMTLADAQSILLGPKDAATQYFRKSMETNLFARFLPIVKTATDKAGVTATYKKFISAGGSGRFGSFVNSVLNPQGLDVDQYVTGKAMDGLFRLVAEEEQRIREHPVARTSQLLQQVFGAIENRAH